MFKKLSELYKEYNFVKVVILIYILQARSIFL
jgi:hypothetical protein